MNRNKANASFFSYDTYAYQLPVATVCIDMPTVVSCNHIPARHLIVSVGTASLFTSLTGISDIYEPV